MRIIVMTAPEKTIEDIITWVLVFALIYIVVLYGGSGSSGSLDSLVDDSKREREMRRKEAIADQKEADRQQKEADRKQRAAVAAEKEVLDVPHISDYDDWDEPEPTETGAHFGYI